MTTQRFNQYSKLTLLLVVFVFSTYAYSSEPIEKSNSKEVSYFLDKTWGSEGSENGQFKGPSGIGVKSNEVYVSDAGNSRVQVFDYDGNFLRSIGQSDAYHGTLRLAQMSRPMNIDFSKDEIYVADSSLHRILVYDLSGQFHRTIGLLGKGNAEFDSLTGLAIDIDTNVHLMAGHDHSQGGDFDPKAVTGDKIIVADTKNNRVQRLRSYGRFLNLIGTENTSDENKSTSKSIINNPTDVAVDPKGNSYILEGKNNKVIVFNTDDNFSHQWKINTSSDLQPDSNWFAKTWSTLFGPKIEEWFAPSTSIAVGPKGNIFVTDFFNGKIFKFTKEGQRITEFGNTNSKDVQYSLLALDVASDGSVFVADYKNQQVQVWRPEGWVAEAQTDDEATESSPMDHSKH